MFLNIVTHLGKTLYNEKQFEAQTRHHARAVLKSLFTVKSAIHDRSLLLQAQASTVLDQLA